jgi:hypothetical protein
MDAVALHKEFSASPLNPSVDRLFLIVNLYRDEYSRSSKHEIFDVVYLSHAIQASSEDMPRPLSLHDRLSRPYMKLKEREIYKPPWTSLISILLAPESNAFSTSSLMHASAVTTTWADDNALQTD